VQTEEVNIEAEIAAGREEQILIENKIKDCEEEIKRRLKSISLMSEESEILNDELSTAKKAFIKLIDVYKSSKESLNSMSQNKCSKDSVSKLMELNAALSASNRELLDAINTIKHFSKQLIMSSDTETELQKLIAENEALKKLVNISTTSKFVPAPSIPHHIIDSPSSPANNGIKLNGTISDASDTLIDNL
jgi:hypothetical protein